MGKNKKNLIDVLLAQDNVMIEHKGRDGSVQRCFTSEEFIVSANENAAASYLDHKYGPNNYTEEQFQRTVKMVENISDILMRKAPSKSEGIKKYRTGLLRMSSNAVAFRVALFETIQMPRESSADALTIICQAADAMICTFEDIGQMDSLRRVIRLSDEIVGLATPVFQLGELFAQRGAISDLLTRDEYNRLLWILTLISADPLYDWLRASFDSEQMIDQRESAREPLEALFILQEFEKVKKIALKQFYLAVGQNFAGMADFIMESLEELDKKKKASAPAISPIMMGNSPQMLQNMSALNLAKADIAKARMENGYTMEEKIDAVKEIMPKWIVKHRDDLFEEHSIATAKPDLTQLGFFFALKDSEVWAATAPAVLMLFETMDRGKDRCRENAERHYSFLKSGKESLDEEDTAELMECVNPVLDMFYEPQKDALPAVKPLVVASNYQMLAMSGLVVYKPEKTLPKRKDIEEMMKVTFIGNPDIPASVIGAIAASTILARSPLCDRPEDASIPEVSTPQVTDVGRMEEDLARLKAQLEQTEQTLKETLQRNEELEKKLVEREADVEVIKSQKKFLQEEMTQLLDTIECMSEETSVPEDVVEEEVFPATFDGKKVIVFGGFTSFLVPLQEFLPELLIYQSNRRPEAGTIKSADAVFLQTNRISHSDFYYVLDTCRENDIPVQVFKTAGAKSCAMQIMELVKTLDSQDTDMEELQA